MTVPFPTWEKLTGLLRGTWMIFVRDQIKWFTLLGSLEIERGREGGGGSEPLGKSERYRTFPWFLWRGGRQASPSCHLSKMGFCKVLCRVRLFVTPWAIARQAPLSMGFSRQEYWRVGCHFLLQARWEVDCKPPPRHAHCESATGKPSVEIIIMVIVGKVEKCFWYARKIIKIF